MLQKILHIGVYEGLSSHDIKKIKVLNAINTICIAAVAVYHIVEIGFNPNPWNNLKMHWFGISAIAVIFYLLHTRHYFAAKIIFVLTNLLNILVFAYVLEPGKMIEYFLMIIPTISLLLFDNKRVNISILIISILCFFVPNIVLENTQMLQAPFTKIVIFVGLYVNFNYLKQLI